MVSIRYDTKNGVRLHGVRHFVDTYGLPREEDAPVGIVYGSGKSPFEFTVRVVENAVQEKMAGWVRYGESDAPIFEEPQDVDGAMLATCQDGSNRICVGESDNEITVGFDVFNEVGRILAGHMEQARYAPAEREKMSKIPSLDFYERLLFDCLLKAYGKKGIPLVRKAMWPDAKGFAVCLTHDVDEVRKTYQHVSGPIKYLLMGQLNRIIRQLKHSASDISSGEDPYWTFEKLITVEEELGVRSSLYFLEEKGKVNLLSPKTLFLMARRYNFADPKVAAMIRRLDEGGWDVGVHGSYYSYMVEELFSSEKSKLENVLGKSVVGTRQHHLNLSFPETWRIHEACGIKYDTSLGFKERTGFRWGTCFPFQPYDGKTDSPIGITEIPTSIMDTPLFYHRGDPWGECKKVMDAVGKYGGVLTLLWHHAVFNEREFPGWAGRYQKIVKSAQQDGAWVTNGRSIAEWWQKRLNTPLKISTADGKTIVECAPLEGLKLEVFDGTGKSNLDVGKGRMTITH